jgi:hypothetical protein
MFTPAENYANRAIHALNCTRALNKLKIKIFSLQP